MMAEFSKRNDIPAFIGEFGVDGEEGVRFARSLDVGGRQGCAGAPNGSGALGYRGRCVTSTAVCTQPGAASSSGSLGEEAMKQYSLAALLAIAGAASAASFDCKLAKTDTEKAICANEEVSTLDEYLGRYYAAARDTLKSADKCLVTDQRIWIREKRNPCKDAACLRAAYLERLAVLDPLQPGATAIRNIELPKVWALVWIVPPAADTVAAPRRRKWPGRCDCAARS